MLVAAGAAVLLGAAIQRLTGLGFSLVCAPVLVVLLGALDGVRLGNLLALGLNAALLWRLHADARWRDAGRLLVPAVAVVVPLGLLARRADGDLLAVVAGATCLAAVAAAARGGVRWRLGVVAAGAMSGAGNVLSGVGGPPIAAHALGRGWAVAETRATMQAMFLPLNVVSVAALGAPHAGWRAVAVLASCAAAGVAVGGRVAAAVPEAVARRALLVVALLGSTAALVRGVVGLATGG